MKKHLQPLLLILTFLISIPFSSSAQDIEDSFKNDFNEANKIFLKYYKDDMGASMYFAKGGYSNAVPIFLKLYKKDTLNSNLAFKLGVCYQSSRRYKSLCIYYFSKAVLSLSTKYKGNSYKEKNAPIIAIKYLADAYHLNYQFDKAIETYELFIATMKKNNKTKQSYLDETMHEIEMCKNGKILLADSINIKITTLGPNVNSPYSDYSPVLTADQNTIFFTSRRIETTGDLKDHEGNNMEDIYMSTKINSVWTVAKSIGAPINTDRHEATVGISPDGLTILIYKDDFGDGNIYSTTLDGSVWTKPIKLNENINTKYWEPSAFISADGSILYFTSDKPGGFGGRDLYTSKLKPNGEWGISQNMGPNINTIYDEDAPFIHPDGVSLSFSSNGHKTMGGFDIFTSLQSSDGNWSEPVNVGYPLNTTDDDIYYVVSPDNRTAYFSSFREGGIGEKDNYMATFINRKETPLTLMKGNVIEESGVPAQDVEITVTDNETEAVLGVYKANKETGQFMFILTPGKNYNITYQAKNHLFYSENLQISKETNYYEIFKPVLLDPIVVGSKIVLNNIFFDFDKSTLRPTSNVELKNLTKLLRANPTMKVEISGHTDSKGDLAYNQKLSEERAQVVVNRLTDNGIPASQMKAAGYGKTMPVANNKNKDGSDDPEGRQLNRRAELKIIEIQ